MTRRTSVTFTIKEIGPNNSPLISLELLSGDSIPELERKVMLFELKPGMTLEQAEDLAKDLRSKLVSLSLTP
jgi:hypothetical protein